MAQETANDSISRLTAHEARLSEACKRRIEAQDLLRSLADAGKHGTSQWEEAQAEYRRWMLEEHHVGAQLGAFRVRASKARRESKPDAH